MLNNTLEFRFFKLFKTKFFYDNRNNFLKFNPTYWTDFDFKKFKNHSQIKFNGLKIL